MTGTDLIIPTNGDLVPRGWAEEVALPTLERVEDWNALGEYSARLNALAAYIESINQDPLEVVKAQRIVDKKIGDLIGHIGTRGRPTAGRLTPPPGETSVLKFYHHRLIATRWKDAWPVIRKADDTRQVSRAAIIYQLRTPENVRKRRLADDRSARKLFREREAAKKILREKTTGDPLSIAYSRLRQYLDLLQKSIDNETGPTRRWLVIAMDQAHRSEDALATAFRQHRA